MFHPCTVLEYIQTHVPTGYQASCFQTMSQVWHIMNSTLITPDQTVFVSTFNILVGRQLGTFQSLGQRDLTRQLQNIIRAYRQNYTTWGIPVGNDDPQRELTALTNYMAGLHARQTQLDTIRENQLHQARSDELWAETVAYQAAPWFDKPEKIRSQWLLPRLRAIGDIFTQLTGVETEIKEIPVKVVDRYTGKISTPIKPRVVMKDTDPPAPVLSVNVLRQIEPLTRSRREWYNTVRGYIVEDLIDRAKRQHEEYPPYDPAVEAAMATAEAWGLDFDVYLNTRCPQKKTHQEDPSSRSLHQKKRS